MTADIEPTLEQRKVIYRSRRGLKELDIYFDHYVKYFYLQADRAEQLNFAFLVDQEDPDLLDWFMASSAPESQEISKLIEKMKSELHQ